MCVHLLAPLARIALLEPAAFLSRSQTKNVSARSSRPAARDPGRRELPLSSFFAKRFRSRVLHILVGRFAHLSPNRQRAAPTLAEQSTSLSSTVSRRLPLARARAMGAAVVGALRELSRPQRYPLSLGVSLITPPIGRAPPLRSPSSTRLPFTRFRTLSSRSGFADGANEAFLGDSGDQHPALEDAAGREAEAMRGGW